MVALRKLGDREIGTGKPVYVIAEIGINHNGSLEIAEKLIRESAAAGADAVKFQKRTPELCTPKDQWEVERDTPWGRMKYIDYRHKVEFGVEEYDKIDAVAKEVGIHWFASCWDEPSVDFMERYEPPAYKAASASLTDVALLKKKKETGRPLIISTGMSSWEQIQMAVDAIGTEQLCIAHSTSSYPCPTEELNLRMIHTLQAKYPDSPIGYSGHETGLATTTAAVAIGATFIERHVTLDRSMWGSDQAASVEMHGLQRLVRNIRDIETALGDGIKKVYESELKPQKKLRRVNTLGA